MDEEPKPYQPPQSYAMTTLDLGCNKLGIAGLIAIGLSTNFTHLIELRLDGTLMDSQGAKALAPSTSLTQPTELGICDNTIDDEGIIALTSSPTFSQLRKLNLYFNRFGLAGAKAIGSPATTLSNLEHLNVGANSIGNDGVAKTT